MTKIICSPLSRVQLRELAKFIREKLNLKEKFYIPVVEWLETLHLIMNDDSFNYEYVEDCELPKNIHAQYCLDENVIKVKNHVLEGALKGNGRDRMTIMHEICHALLIKYLGINLGRTFEANIPTYQDPEWQAKCLAGEIMMPHNLIIGMNKFEVAKYCGVSVQAAAYQISKL